MYNNSLNIYLSVNLFFWMFVNDLHMFDVVSRSPDSGMGWMVPSGCGVVWGASSTPPSHTSLIMMVMHSMFIHV